MKSAGERCATGEPGTCQSDTFCDGISAVCLPPLLVAPKPAGSMCRPLAGPCDTPETCDGLSHDCPPDVWKPATTICRPAAGECDVDDYCTGFSPQCTSNDDKASVFTVCREAEKATDQSTCDLQERCDGVHDTCPPDIIRPAGSVCRPATGRFGPGTAGQECDLPETCDGLSKTCPTTEARLPLGTQCRVQTDCREAATCKGVCGGIVTGGPCSSDAECSPGVLCLPVLGVYACASPATLNGTPCDGGAGTCESGTCTSRLKFFGETCDGNDSFTNGDPVQRHCGDDPNYTIPLICCAGSRLAKTGETGTCAECCNGALYEQNGGCPETFYNTQRCCNGACKDLGEDPHDCGECGNDCFTIICPSGDCADLGCIAGSIAGGECGVDGCGVSCGSTNEGGVFTPGICVYDTVCRSGEVCIPPITEDWANVVNEIGCDRYLECRNWESGGNCDYRFYGDIVGVECPLTAQPLQCVEPPPPGHCGSCKTNDDCYGGDVCLPSCATSTAQGPFVGADCSTFGICATDYDECR